MPDEKIVDNPNPNPPTHASTAPNSAGSSMAAQLEKMFPGGVIPDGHGSNKTAERMGVPDAPPAPTPPAPTPPPPSNDNPPPPPADDKPPVDPVVAAVKAAAAKTAADDKLPPDDKATPPPDDKGKLTDAQLDKAQGAMDVKAGTAFKFVRGENDRLKGELEKVQKEAQDRIAAAEAKASTINETEVTELRDRVARYEADLAVTHVESTEQFQKEIAQPLKAAEDALLQLAAKYDITPSKLSAALSNPDPAKRSDELADLSANFNRLDIARFDQLTVDAERLTAKRQTVLQDATQKLQEYQTQQRAEQLKRAEEFKTSWKTALTSTRQLLEKEVPIFKKTGDEKWDAQLIENLAKVDSLDIMNASNEEIAKAFYNASVFPMVLKLVGDLYGENTGLTEELARYKGTTPGAGAGSAPSKESPDKKAPATMAEALKSGLQGILPP